MSCIPSLRLQWYLPVAHHAALSLLPHEGAVCGIAIDSRKVRPGDVFVALRGSNDDGTRYLADAAQRGARCALVEGDRLPADAALPCIAVRNTREVAGTLADAFAGSPSAALSLVGITGTNGKTTVSWLLAQVLDRAGLPCGVLGTLGIGRVPTLRSTGLTTVDVVANHQAIADLVARGVRAAAMEVSSHALHQQRVAGLRFALAVFTNLSRDHLDYHGDMQAYAEAKHRLLDWPGLVARVINIDDPIGARWATEAGTPVVRYGVRNATADVRFDLDTATSSVGGRLHTPAGSIAVQTGLVGEFNASNLAAACAAALALGIDLDRIAAALPTLTAAPGRMQRFASADAMLAVVDFAHTPDGLEHALNALRPQTRGVLWCVFGCGGDRDRGKRPLMAAVADRLADRVVLTDDNPRTEDPEQIFADARDFGAPRAQWSYEHDRERAIRLAVASAQAGDVVLIAGKGHEDYQEVAGVRRPFSDALIVADCVRARAAQGAA